MGDGLCGEDAGGWCVQIASGGFYLTKKCLVIFYLVVEGGRTKTMGKRCFRPSGRWTG
jgi:hypothetical protein